MRLLNRKNPEELNASTVVPLGFNEALRSLVESGTIPKGISHDTRIRLAKTLGIKITDLDNPHKARKALLGIRREVANTLYGKPRPRYQRTKSTSSSQFFTDLAAKVESFPSKLK